MSSKKVFLTLAGIAVLVVVIGGIVLTSLGTARMKASPLGNFAPMMPSYDLDESTDSSGGDNFKGAAATAVAAPRQVIKTASLRLLVENAEEVLPQVTALVNGKGGFVESSSVYETSGGGKAGQMTVRVPATELDSSLVEIKKFAAKVEREEVGAEDVTAQLVDMDARLKNLYATEEQYRELMRRSGSISDIGNVVQYLSQTRGQIEQLEAQKKSMTERVAMSSIRLSLESVSEATVGGVVWRPFTTIKRAWRSLLSDLASFADHLLTFLIKLPIWILRIAVVVLVLWVLWKVFLWLRPKFSTTTGLQ